MQNDVTIFLQPIGKELSVIKNTPLIDILHEFGVEFPCGGKGTCGRCKVKLLKGDLPVDPVQQAKIDKLQLGPEWRLACYCNCESDITLEISQLESIILADNSDFDFSPQEGYGIAVDLGTTTLVVQVVDLQNGSVIDVETAVNPQVKFGSDVISRIQSALEGNQESLINAIRSKIADMVNALLRKHPVNPQHAVIVGNTAMHHLFCGLPVQSLSFYPFESPYLHEYPFRAVTLGWNVKEECQVLFYPSIGSFVGSDILAGIAATKMFEKENYSILIDLGTNGEIVLGNRNHILCASTAAGPAFEGAKISQGMRATTGAISSVSDKSGGLNCHVIGNTVASGICGSGLIDAMSVFLANGVIGDFGEINSGEEKLRLRDNVWLTQQDIREFQLAKAAIAAGLQILLNKTGITFSEVETIYIAGGFGNFINEENLVTTGIIETDPGKIQKMGNTALIGAKMFLFRGEELTRKILKICSHINLESDPDFQDIYIWKMAFAT